MFYREQLPDRALRHTIKCYWFLQGRLDARHDERILPDGCSELVFHCGDTFSSQDVAGLQEQPRTLLVGPSTRAVVVRPGLAVDVIGVRFRPGGLALLGGAPAAELRDGMVAAMDAGSKLPRVLLDRLADLHCDSERAALLDGVFRRRLAVARLDAPMLALQLGILAAGGNLRTRHLAQATGLSARQVQRRFLAATGLAPKLFARLVRFQRALACAQQPDLSLAAVAATAGYADQAHFTRDFREFAGVSPAEHFRAAGALSDYFIDDEPISR